MNIIDGFNGLASGVCLLVLAGIMYVAYDVKDVEASWTPKIKLIFEPNDSKNCGGAVGAFCKFSKETCKAYALHRCRWFWVGVT